MSTIQKAMGKIRHPLVEDQKAKEDKADLEELASEMVKEEAASSGEVIQQAAEAVMPERTSKKVNADHKPPKLIDIDIDELSDNGMVGPIHDGASKLINDEFRAIKHKVIKNAFGENSHLNNNSDLIMVTSSKPNEGKTFVSINLAMSIALEKDKTVLLIDADVLKPSVSNVLDIGSDRPGLIEYLLGEVDDISDVIYPTSVPNLRLIPAGMPNHLSYELLSSDRMIALTKELAERYDDRILLFDCPPILGVVETVVLSSLMGQAMVVVEQDKTRVGDIKAAVSQLSNDLVLGFIVNKVVRGTFTQQGYGYGYASYGLGYGYGYNAEAEPSK